MEERLHIRAAGFVGGDKFVVRGLMSRCGNIEDGISINLPGSEYGGVISFDDLEAVYYLAKQAREEAAELGPVEG